MHPQGRTGNTLRERERGEKEKEEKERTNLFMESITKWKETTTPSKQWPLYKPITTPKKHSQFSEESRKIENVRKN